MRQPFISLFVDRCIVHVYVYIKRVCMCFGIPEDTKKVVYTIYNTIYIITLFVMMNT